MFFFLEHLIIRIAGRKILFEVSINFNLEMQKFVIERRKEKAKDTYVSTYYEIIISYFPSPPSALSNI